ncbi:hypothetical protein SH580_18270 [Coraliomargarita algicola]|uniref:DUF642 domain-containing protein n=1 Tax=Coraliomargarita algicola TaxID=3092156 RepID=A0ABZ0RGR9_9BACT|nr:hypothetical protein [Coraliomargarita sp. J2-16]WPJ95370.1 hypothetical protein SH580_18270 [Coraliomargarita sp. J2-16]
MKKTLPKSLAILLPALPLLSLTVNAQSVVFNGSFEFANAAQAAGTETPTTGGTFGWTVDNSTVLPSESVGDGNFFNQEASDGSYLLNMNVNGSYAEQTLTLVEGTTYNVSFDWNLGVNGANTSSATMSVLLGGGMCSPQIQLTKLLITNGTANPSP